MAYTSSRFRNGITRSLAVSRARPLPALTAHTATSKSNHFTIAQSKYIMRHSHEAIVKQYQQSISELVDDFERELQLKDEIIVSLHAEIARLRCNTINQRTNTKLVEFLIGDDADDVEATDEIDENFPLYDDRDESLASPCIAQETCFDAVPNEMNGDNVIAEDEKLIETVYDDDDFDDVDEDEEEEEEEATVAAANAATMDDCIKIEQRTPKLLSIKIQPNKTEVIHQCELCRKIVSTRRTLMKHIRIVHATQKPYSCEYCTRSFPQKDGLKRHLRIHTGEKPFVCAFCKKCFNQSGNLRIHEKSCKKLMTICD